jgi:ParB-like chromosome segregation protein Spo0J
LKAPKEKLFLRNRDLELNPTNQKQSPIYIKTRDHIKKIGYIINPLLTIKDGNKYKVVYGNNRYLAGLELGFTDFPIKVLKNDKVSTIREAAKDYKEINLDEF